MRVTLIAETTMVDLPASVRETEYENLAGTEGSAADRLAHFSGRSCYQAWGMARKETANDMGYLANIIKQGHFSVLEHASATFYIEGVSRSLTHELVRHRHLSYSQLSQRYVDMSEAEFIVPPALRGDMEAHHMLDNVDELKASYEEFVDYLIEQKHLPRKKAREAARAILPNNIETKIVVTGNHRAWRDMLQKRYSVHADAEILELATELLRQLREVAPGSFQDMPEEPFQ